MSYFAVAKASLSEFARQNRESTGNNSTYDIYVISLVGWGVRIGRHYARGLNYYLRPKAKGGFPLSRNFYVRTDVNFNWLYVRKLK